MNPAIPHHGRSPLPQHHRKTLIALAASAALATGPALALELVQEPPMPTSKSAFVAPNVIISIDDSGSMNFRIKDSEEGSGTGAGYTYPKADGTWNVNARRINILKYALKEVFNDTDLISTNKIRLSWQAMWNNGKSSNAKSVDSGTMNQNSMRPIDAMVTTGSGKNAVTATHRANFLTFVEKLSASGGTPSHLMFEQADGYMRRSLNKNGPWSSDPGGTGSKAEEYLGCRRNYHIMMTDGRWNGTVSGGEKDNTATTLPDGTAYSLSSDQTNVYRSDKADTLADWAFYSWSNQLQNPTDLKDANKLKPAKTYEEAPSTELFTAQRDVTTTVSVSGSNSTQRKNNCLAVPGRQWVSNTCQETATETKQVNLEKYWNPKYNPATWPHMVTYTIGFSTEAVTWPGSPEIAYPSEFVPASFDGAFPELVTGYQVWPNMSSESKRSADLWHAAINGRGRFYAVNQAEDLAKAFREIIGKINEEAAPLPDKISPGGTSSGYSLAPEGNMGLFATVYNAKDGWSGYVTATPAREPEVYACPTEDDSGKKCTRFPDPTGGWNGKNTAQQLDGLGSPDYRRILTWNDKTSQGSQFLWADDETYLSTTQKALLGSSNTSDPVNVQGKNILNFIRGDQSLEGDGTTSNPAKPFRKRFSRQGDIVNSDIWYIANPVSNYVASGYSNFVSTYKNRTPMLYVGGNDGMLHGFSAEDGTEKIAYVPRGVLGNLKKLADKDYAHQYYVDGSPMTGDVYSDSAWKTMLVGTLGAGGKGYFVLDVTNPAQFGMNNAKDMVVLDKTGTGIAADIGQITAKPLRNPNNRQETPQITRTNNGRWAVIMGNGVNSANQRPVLLVQYLDGDLALKTISATSQAVGTGNAQDNGLFSPAIVDLDGNGTVDVVYAGDNLSNLWKFDLTSDSESDWKPALGNNVPLFTAKGLKKTTDTNRTEIQPITASPIVRPNTRMMEVGTGANKKTVPIGGMMVAFGTGRNLTANDRRTDIDQPVQTVYSVLDNARYRIKSGKTHLEIHPGTGAGDCSSNNYANTCVPAPAAVGTMLADGKPLAQQKIKDIDTLAGFQTLSTNQELKKETWKNYKGWYLDLPFKGERVIEPMQFYDGSNILAVYSESPDGTKSSSSDNINESCVPVKIDTSSGTMFRTLINIMDGKAPSVQLVDAYPDGVYDEKDKNAVRTTVDKGSPLLVATPTEIIDKTGGGNLAGPRMPEQSMRPGWRQVK